MALLLVEGFDKYGPTNSVSANVISLLTQGEWNSVIGSAHTIAAPLSATGYTLNIGVNSGLAKTLSASYGRLIGGFRFNSNLGNTAGIAFQDAGTDQAAVTINSTGAISVRNGSVQAGTILGTSTATVTAGTTHYVEFDITFGNVGVGAYQCWLDGVSVLSGAGDTTTTANNSANGITLRTSTSVSFTVDDLYLLDTTGPAPLNAPLLTSPRIETQFPASDGAVQFAVGAAVLGSSVARTTSSNSINATTIRLRSVVPTANCSLTAISFMAGTGASGSISLRPVVYASTSGNPGTLLGSGATSIGTTASTVKTMPLTTPVNLVAGTQYFIGYQNDILLTNGAANLSTAADDLINTSTSFAGAAPATAPAMVANQSTIIWGNVTPATNAFVVSQNPAQGSASYIYDAMVSHEDLYNFPALSVVPSTIYGTAIKASVSKSDAGAKTVSVRQKSGATDSAGSAGTQAPGTSYTWITSLFPTDPNGNVTWTKAALDAAQGGVRVES